MSRCTGAAARCWALVALAVLALSTTSAHARSLSSIKTLTHHRHLAAAEHCDSNCKFPYAASEWHVSLAEAADGYPNNPSFADGVTTVVYKLHVDNFDASKRDWENVCDSSSNPCSTNWATTCAQTQAQDLSHWVLGLGASCKAVNGVSTTASPSGGGWSEPDPTTCATGWKFGLGQKTGTTVFYTLRIAGVVTSWADIAFAVKGATRYSLGEVWGPAACGPAPGGGGGGSGGGSGGGDPPVIPSYQETSISGVVNWDFPAAPSLSGSAVTCEPLTVTLEWLAPNGAPTGAAATTTTNPADGSYAFRLILTPGTTVRITVSGPDGAFYQTTAGSSTTLSFASVGGSVSAAPLTLTRRFTVSGTVKLDLAAPFGSTTCPQLPAISPDDADVSVAVNGAPTPYAAGAFSASGVALGDSLTFTVASANPTTILATSPPFTTAATLTPADLLAAMDAAAIGVCSTAAIPAACLTVGRLHTLSGQIWIDTETNDPPAYAPGRDGLFGCDITVTVASSSSGAVFATATAPAATGAFSVPVLEGDSYTVTANTDAAACAAPLLPYLAPPANPVGPIAVTAAGAADPALFPYIPLPPPATPPVEGRGHTLGFWKTNAQRFLAGNKVQQYTREQYLAILTAATSMARPDVLALGAGGGVTGDNLLRAVVAVLDSTSPAPRDRLLKQLLATEISYSAGFRMTDEAAQRYLVLWAENVAAAGTDVGLMNSLAVLLDQINNLPNK
ncbi:hypothetical protein HXX76_008456 [Chlamydomonas incerta]|uniref:Uncharacterized protein n=1 Tax=Chlamydomonas incerta TaxID=51695 RepID=A0A835T095_CHLIN|nr:hypothetical protein HXX76_008456 [Chlamydomonas incerta]|eukprot:KAG2433398.1 hypothetical protein HXX76_008456 [Chlamydomonas incerta]